jgi:hypothetical protein
MVDVNRQLFDPGRCAVTPGALAALEAVGIDPMSMIRRHASGDWGVHGTFEETTVTDRERQYGSMATADDAKLNRLAVESNNGSRIMSEYRLDDADETRIWISTEGGGAERVTVVMLPSEY